MPAFNPQKPHGLIGNLRKAWFGAGAKATASEVAKKVVVKPLAAVKSLAKVAAEEVRPVFDSLQAQGLQAQNPDQSAGMLWSFQDVVSACRRKGFGASDVDLLYSQAVKTAAHRIPKALERRAAAIQRSGHSEQAAYAIATKASQREGRMQVGSHKLTNKGKGWETKHKKLDRK